jgi:DNA-binding MarR family transcriptional regulator
MAAGTWQRSDQEVTRVEHTFGSIPTTSLDEIVHQRVRLGILTIVHEARRVEFSFFAEALSLTGGNLSQHLRVLEDAGHIRIDKGTQGRRPRTWVSITASGRRAFLDEISALKAIVSRVEGANRVGD